MDVGVLLNAGPCSIETNQSVLLTRPHKPQQLLHQTSFPFTSLMGLIYILLTLSQSSFITSARVCQSHPLTQSSHRIQAPKPMNNNETRTQGQTIANAH